MPTKHHYLKPNPKNEIKKIPQPINIIMTQSMQWTDKTLTLYASTRKPSVDEELSCSRKVMYRSLVSARCSRSWSVNSCCFDTRSPPVRSVFSILSYRSLRASAFKTSFSVEMNGTEMPTCRTDLVILISKRVPLTEEQKNGYSPKKVRVPILMSINQAGWRNSLNKSPSSTNHSPFESCLWP